MIAISFPCLLLLISVTLASCAGQNGMSSVLPDPKQIFAVKPPFLSPEVEHYTSDDKKESKGNIILHNLVSTSINTEGGVVSIPPTEHPKNKNTDVITRSDKLDESQTRENIPKERNFSPSVVARKGVQEKIKPRKGVEQNIDPEKSDMSFNQTSFTNTKPVIETNSALEIVRFDNQSKTSNIIIPRSNITIQQSKGNSNHSTNSINLALLDVSHTGIVNNITNTFSHVEKHIPKPKPTVTIVDGPEIDYRPSLHTKSSPLGMSRKVDYIVPVVTTIFALPLFAAVIFVLYRRGRDCWDKRHYRRMDFLIDGMYND